MEVGSLKAEKVKHLFDQEELMNLIDKFKFSDELKIISLQGVRKESVRGDVCDLKREQEAGADLSILEARTGTSPTSHMKEPPQGFCRQTAITSGRGVSCGMPIWVRLSPSKEIQISINLYFTFS